MRGLLPGSAGSSEDEVLTVDQNDDASGGSRFSLQRLHSVWQYMTMMPPSNADILAGFEASIPEAEIAVVMAVRNVATYSGQTGEIEVRLSPMRADRAFASDLTLIRNEVVAHFVSKESGVENSARWALSRDALQPGEDALLRSKIVEFSIALSIGQRELSHGMTSASSEWITMNKQIIP